MIRDYNRPPYREIGLELGCEVMVIDPDAAAADGRARIDDHAALLRRLRQLGVMTLHAIHDDSTAEIVSAFSAHHIVPLGDVERFDATPTRLRRLHELAERYPGDWTPDRDGAPFEELAEGRYAGLSYDLSFDTRGGAGGYWISTSSDLDRICRLLGELADESDPRTIFDLDTGQEIPITVTTIVTPTKED